MSKQALINKTVSALEKLPHEKVGEIADYIDYLLKKYEEEYLQKGIEELVSDSKSFEFLAQEQDLYTVGDLKDKYR